MKTREPSKSVPRFVCFSLCRFMMTSSNGTIFRVTGHLCGYFIGHRWIPHTKTSDVEIWCVFYLRPNKRLSKQSWGWWFQRPSRPLSRQCNVATIGDQASLDTALRGIMFHACKNLTSEILNHLATFSISQLECDDNLCPLIAADFI